MTDQPVEGYQYGVSMAVRNHGRWGLWGNTAKASEPDSWEYWETSVPDAGQTGEEALAELLSESLIHMHDPLCLYCGKPLSVTCECSIPPVQDPDPCPVHGLLRGMMLWDGEDQYGRPVGGWRTFCIQCEKARNAAGLW
jgi:hypothetical protein